MYFIFSGTPDEWSAFNQPFKQELENMAKAIDRINAGLDNLDAKTTEEAQQVQAAVQGLKDEVAALKEQIANGATETELNAAADRIESKIADVENIFTPDTTPTPDTGNPTDGGASGGTGEPV
jgi:chromosome segregation ATPase